ncbi:hypothetical protein [Spirosoma endophyticum]|uniref:Uncharacterized protein n=1 Tax=Spirosoma endophyticum TaxID=662367 RepID=A0A1I2GGV8_9BACT|nr:hypothetical protein [Spirosoma endophyticum]SFF16220.1 hypothetical protein SAMN05216167_1327 [Spirosoma endophyticum]
MKKSIYFLVGMLLGIDSILYAQEVLNNQSIITLVRAKVARDLILDKIKASASQFNMSTNGLVELKQATVPDPILDAMMLASSPLPTLRNQDVIDLYTGKVSREIITKKIQYSETSFNLSTDDIVALKAAKVPDQLVKVMMVPKRAQQQSTNPNLIAGVLAPHPETLPTAVRSRFAEPGIYYEEYKTPKPQYLQVEPTTTNQTKTGSVGEAVINQYTGGIPGTTQRVGLANKSANMVVEDNRPVFYLVFSGVNRKTMNDVAESIFDGVASPNDFVLIRAKVSGRGREVIIGRQSAYTSESGFSTGAVPFRFKKISNTLYKVYFEQDVAAGEYAFLYNKGSEFSSSLKIYDFSLRNNTK